MFPSFSLLGREIPFYGLFCVFGVALAILVALFRARKLPLDKMDIFFGGTYAAIGLVIGGKILFLIVSLPEVVAAGRQSASLLLNYLMGGFVWYGGLFGIIGGLYIYCRQYKLRFLPLLDACIVGVPLAHIFGRIGCLSAGCCYGAPYDGPGHIIFHNSGIAPNGVPLFPSQLAEAAANLILFIALALYARRTRPTGRVTGIYLAAYAVIRFILEFWRGDPDRGLFLGISTSQLISVLLLPIALMLIFSKRFRRIDHEEA